MKKPIVICCDGTLNTFGRANTNVRRIFDALDGRQCHRYYDPGIGTEVQEKAVGITLTVLRNVGDAALAIGQMQKVCDAYTYLSKHHEPGARVYLFGFSRGAWCVRRLAKMVQVVGLPPPGCEHLVRYAYKAYDNFKTNESKEDKEYKFYRSFQSLGQKRIVDWIFVGAWDTVRSAGGKWRPKDCALYKNDETTVVARHAVSLDERRRAFEPELWDNDERVLQKWFAGDHSDVGGGNDVSAGVDLSYLSLEWICNEANDAFLHIKLDDIRQRAKEVRSNQTLWAERKKYKRNQFWYPGRFIGKKTKRKHSKTHEIDIDESIWSRVRSMSGPQQESYLKLKSLEERFRR